MRICPTHWSMLKAACTSRGMNHLIHASGEAVFEATVRELQGTDDLQKDFDPLMQANWMVMGRALNYGGLYLMGTPEGGGEYCPICESVKHMESSYDRKDYPTMEAHWTEGVMAAVLAEARERGLMPRPA